ncbi:MAG TPA: TetR family transcriptional regulator [Stellaceae bacterium]|nr:TetR family transcriptional regulator [Stellaceae bacterium]
MPRARKSPTRSIPTGDVKSRLIAAAMALAAAQGWRRLGMGEIAREAGVTLDEAYRIFPTRPALLAGFAQQVNESVLSGPDDTGGTPRERLFELLMRRFDTLKPHRAALKAIARDSIGDPAALFAIPIGLNAMAWMLEAAGIGAEGWRGRARCLALAGAYAATLRVFLGDDSEDLSKTMAALDRRLKSGPFGTGDARRAA